tara:strand:- start:155 stop:538 length:384 start_codon:yes stop_codon:yes gene_type:complete
MGRRHANRQVTRFDTATFVPIDRFGGTEGTMTWHNLSYDPQTGRGSYLMVMAPGASSRPHRHTGAEEFHVIEGDLVDFDGQVYHAGDFVRLEPGTTHTSLSPNGCKLLVTQWGHTEPVGIDQLEFLK